MAPSSSTDTAPHSWRPSSDAGDGRGRQNVVINRRSWAQGTAPNGSRAGWSKQQSNPKLFVQAPVNLAELTGDLGGRFVETVECRVLGSYDLAPLVLPAQRTAVEARIAALKRDRDAAQREADDHRRTAKALAGDRCRVPGEGDREQFQECNGLAVQRDGQARAADERGTQLQARIERLCAEVAAPAPVEDALANLSPAAYVAETLRRVAPKLSPEVALSCPWSAAHTAV